MKKKNSFQTFMEKHRNLAYTEQLLEDINRAERDRFEVKKKLTNSSKKDYGFSDFRPKELLICNTEEPGGNQIIIVG